jgi:hypothetical protein
LDLPAIKEDKNSSLTSVSHLAGIAKLKEKYVKVLTCLGNWSCVLKEMNDMTPLHLMY